MATGMQLDDPHAFAAEDLIEGGIELRVPIAEQELGHQLTALELPGQVAGLVEAFNILVS